MGGVGEAIADKKVIEHAVGDMTKIAGQKPVITKAKKPIAGFIAGATAPPGRRMGHAGAIVGGAEDTAAAKKRILADCGIAVAETPSVMADTLLKLWGK